MKGKILLALLLVLAALTLVPFSFASDCIPYCDVGTIATPHSYYATTTGQVTVTFYGFQADFIDYVGIYNWNTDTTSDSILFNQGGPQIPITVNVTAGDMVSFAFADATTRWIWDSEFYMYTPDGQNHVFGANKGSDVFLAFEDLMKSEAGDFDYNDLEVTVTNVTMVDWVAPPSYATLPPWVATPEPTSLLLLGSGISGLALRMRKRR